MEDDRVADLLAAECVLGIQPRLEDRTRVPVRSQFCNDPILVFGHNTVLVYFH
jgi:hypothetical protein